ncbi:hypothetical protein Nmel_017944 [Mimus melanotis]
MLPLEDLVKQLESNPLGQLSLETTAHCRRSQGRGNLRFHESRESVGTVNMKDFPVFIGSMFLYSFEDSLCFKSSVVLAICSFPQLNCGTSLLLFFTPLIIYLSALLEMELVPSMEMRGSWEVTAHGRLGFFAVIVVLAVVLGSDPGAEWRVLPQTPEPQLSWVCLQSQPAGPCAGCSKSPQPHSAGSSSCCRLEAANPSTSDSSYGERASGRSSAYSRRENRLAALSGRADDESNRDYKKLYESALSENQKLKSKLQEAQLELADIKAKLEKAAQKQEKTSDRSSMLEMEKREKRALERKLSEMEEEMKNLHQLKQIHTLRQMNEQLLAENRALTRVVARLSLPPKPSESEEL